jgi:hypothetical protein
MAEAPTSNLFLMHGARAAIAGGMLHIEEQVKGIERAVIENPGLAFDLAKTLIESACKTILSERKIGFTPDDDLPKLFKIAAKHLPFLPVEASDEAEARRSLSQTLSGLHTAVQGVCELRNACGFASHGAAGPRPAMEFVQALLAAEAADTIVGFLHRVHRQERVPPPGPRLEYEDNPDFNDYVDDANEALRIFGVEYRPSEVLFRVDQEAYRIYLAEYEPELGPREATPDKAENGEVAP